MRQAMSGSSRQATVIGNRPDPFVDTAFVTDSTWPRRGMPAAIYRHNSTASWLIAAGSGIAAPARGMSRSRSLAPDGPGNDETADRRRRRDEDFIELGFQRRRRMRNSEWRRQASRGKPI